MRQQVQKQYGGCLVLAILLLLPSGNFGQGFGNMLGSMVGGLFGGVSNPNGRAIEAVNYRLPSPPALVGPIAPNNDLVNAERLHEGLVKGPGSFVNYQGHLYAGTSDNKIYDMASCKPKLIADLRPPGCTDAHTCGQGTSIRRDPTTGDLLVLDTYRGLYRVNVTTGDVELIFNSKTPVAGRAPVHLNDMVVTNDGIIIMSDSSDKFEFGEDVYIGMEGRASGRLIAYVPKTGSAQQLLPNTFVFPNGLELTHDGSALLVSETGRVRIQRVSLQSKTMLQVSTFSQNLPGLPDNIRASDRGTYWVGMSYPRNSRTQNPMDQYSTNPWYRTQGASRMSYASLEGMFSVQGIAVELNAFGQIVKSIQDPSGQRMRMVSEVNEFGGVLNIGSPEINYMARIIVPGRPLKLDSFMELALSRCQVTEAKADEVRQMLNEKYFKKQTPN